MNPLRQFNACVDCGAYVFFLFVATSGIIASDALICNCTQDSPRTKCHAGICEAPSNAASCLMLEHPVSGRHYTCSTAHLPDGSCTEKITKTGVRVNVCSCDSSDYCNHKFWPQYIPEDDDSDYYNNQQVAVREVAVQSLRERSANAAPMHRFTLTSIATTTAHILFVTLFISSLISI